MVFDGQNLTAKAATEEKRRESRALAKKRAIECIKLNKTHEARKNFVQAVDVSPRMALKLIQACRKRKIDCIVAPYEADAQLAFLNKNRFVDFVISEDSDLIVFGCSKVLFKLDISGNGVLVEREKLFVPMREKPDTFDMDKFRYMCILSGCDYLDSLPGVGLKKAMKFIKTISSQSIYEALPKLPRVLNLKNIVVTNEYRNDFMIADATFRHQIVFDPIARKLTFLTDPEVAGTDPEHLCNAGEMIDNDIAFQLAIGNRSPSDLEILDNWSPDSDPTLHTLRISIWSKNYTKNTPAPVTSPSFPTTVGKNLLVTNNRLNITTTDDDVKQEEKIQRDMRKMYFDVEPPPKRIRLSSSQKENDSDTSPVLNRQNIFAKKNTTELIDDDSDEDFKSDRSQPNLKRIKKTTLLEAIDCIKESQESLTNGISNCDIKDEVVDDVVCAEVETEAIRIETSIVIEEKPVPAVVKMETVQVQTQSFVNKVNIEGEGGRQF